MELLLIYRPRRDGRLSWPSWLTHSGRLTHEVVTRQPWIRRRSRKVRQLRTDVLTTEPRRQPAGGRGRAKPARPLPRPKSVTDENTSKQHKLIRFYIAVQRNSK